MISKPMINVKDVAKSRAFYRETLGFEGTREGDHYDQLVFKGEEVLQLHFFHAPEFSEMWDIDKPVGNGAIFWFHTDDFDASVVQIRCIRTAIRDHCCVTVDPLHTRGFHIIGDGVETGGDS